MYCVSPCNLVWINNTLRTPVFLLLVEWIRYRKAQKGSIVNTGKEILLIKGTAVHRFLTFNIQHCLLENKVMIWGLYRKLD